MLTDYFHWQFILGPAWLLHLLWNLERASLRFFSVKYMVRTLFAYWHKDAMPFTGGSLTKLATTLLWNIISRTIGFTIRSIVLLTWLAAQIIYLPLAISLLVLYIAWPLLVVVGISVGLSLFLV